VKVGRRKVWKRYNSNALLGYSYVLAVMREWETELLRRRPVWRRSARTDRQPSAQHSLHHYRASFRARFTLSRSSQSLTWHSESWSANIAGLNSMHCLVACDRMRKDAQDFEARTGVYCRCIHSTLQQRFAVNALGSPSTTIFSC